MDHHPPPLRIGSLCSGYRGLDMAVEEVFGGTTAWVSDVDPGANKILAHRWPATPNIGDLTTARWEDVEPVDIVCGGYPCQPFSTAGKRKGTADARHLWPFFAGALGVLRPRVAIFENVAGHLRLGFDTVLADLARLGFDAEWCLVRASEVGAPHRRERLFIYATAADAGREQPQRRGERGVVGGEAAAQSREGDQRERAGHTAGNRGEAAADAADLGHNRPGSARGRRVGPADRGVAAADTAGDMRRLGDRDALRTRGDEDGRASTAGAGATADADRVGWGADVGDVRAGQPDVEWGGFEPAIHRWEAVLGRPHPGAIDDRGRLSPQLVEWMMGLPAGHVTQVPELTRTQQLKALGNGVVPQQAAAAIRLLAARAFDGAVAA